MVNWKKDLEYKLAMKVRELEKLEAAKKSLLKGGDIHFFKEGFKTVRVTPRVLRRRSI